MEPNWMENTPANFPECLPKTIIMLQIDTYNYASEYKQWAHTAVKWKKEKLKTMDDLNKCFCK